MSTAGVAQEQAAAQEEFPADSIEAIAQVRIDLDRDAVPERIGDTVSVAGRVSAQQGNFILSDIFFVQDRSAGIPVLLPPGKDIQRGDSIQVRGVVEQAYGLTQLHGLAYRLLEGPRRTPSPLPLTVSAAVGENFEGSLVRVEGRVARKDSNDGGEYLLLEDIDEGSSPQITVFVPHARTERIQLDRFQTGDEIRVTGTVSQYDRSPPLTDYYQLWPRGPEDLSRVGLVTAYLWMGILAAMGLLLLGLLALFTLRATVKRRTQELAESRSRFQRLAEATFEGIIVHDDGRIVDTNEALVRMLGRDQSELIGEDLVEVLSQGTHDLNEEELEGEDGSPTEAVVVRADGTSFPVEIEEKTVRSGDDSIHVAALRDISDRKKREEKLLRAKQEAEQMARLKSSLLNNMSHEFRTPITSIIGYAELIMKETEGPPEEFASQIRQSGKRLSETLRAVLEMAQLEAGTLSPQAQDVEVSIVAEEVADRYRSMAEDKDLSLEVVASEECALRTDRTLLYRVLCNLVHNAIKFTDEGSIRIAVESDSSGVEVMVEDTGIGIHEEFQSQLFDPFTQESDGRAREYEGMGLGLTLTKRMVGLLGGNVTVDSAKKEGSTFIVTIPPLMGNGPERALGLTEDVE